MRIHFVGIGGIGISALARHFLKEGNKVSGSDLSFSENIQDLRKIGIKIFIGKHKKKNLSKNTDLVIYSPAIPKNNPELKKAKELRIKCLSYPEALGQLTKKYFTIAVCGTHGKTTTTALIALILQKGGCDPTVIVGTKLKEFEDSNYRKGKSKYLVIEADEHFASFLNYWPQIIVLTSIDREHLDYYKNLGHILKTYKEFLKHLPKNGIAIVNGDDKNIKKIIPPKTSFLVKKYSIKEEIVKKISKILKIPGLHNVSNALAALKTARILKIPQKIVFKVFASYQGAWRRFEIKDIKFKNKKIKIISDYAHHPTEIEATLKSTRQKFPKKEIFCLFQPHQYQRTYYLFSDFVKVFSKAIKEKWIDSLLITDIYDVAGREKKEIKKKINSQKLVEKIKKREAIYLPQEKIIDYFKKNLKNNLLLIIMGAGDIYKISSKFR